MNLPTDFICRAMDVEESTPSHFSVPFSSAAPSIQPEDTMAKATAINIAERFNRECPFSAVDCGRDDTPASQKSMLEIHIFICESRKTVWGCI